MAGRNKEVIKDGKVVGWVHSDYFDGYAPDQLFNQEVLESMEFFEALKTFVIDTRSEGLKEVTGTKLTDEYFAHNDGPYSKWHITDTASGLAIAIKLPTLKACKEYLQNLSDDVLAKIEQIRFSDKYKAQCEKVANFKAAKVESFDFMEAFEALDDLEKDTEQKLFFDELN